ncbi:MAG: head GIN domain-containing protein [Sphingomicrobium sp.]
MKRIFVLAATALAASACHLGASAQDRDPGATANRNYQVGAFDKIEVAGPYDVTVATGRQAVVSARGGERLLDETEVFVEGGTLKIRAKKHTGMNVSWGHRGKAEFTVSTRMLRGAQIAGSGELAVDKINGDFNGSVAGSGDLRLASVNGGASEFSIAGSGSITAAGRSQSAKMEVAGSGDINAGALATSHADVSIAGSGNVRANASGTATVAILGSGDVEVTGGAKCSVSKHGSGNVTCG